MLPESFPISSIAYDRLALKFLKVKHKTTVKELPGSIPGSGKDFYVCLFVNVVFLLLCQKHMGCHACFANYSSSLHAAKYVIGYKGITIQTWHLHF